MKRTLLLCSIACLPLIAITADEAIDSAAIWTANCKKCHADDGSGKTKMGQRFDAKDYTDPAVQASFTDEEIVKVTKEGAFDDKGKKKMPRYNEKLTDEEIQALIPLIRSFAKE